MKILAVDTSGPYAGAAIMEDGVVTNVAFVGGCNGNLKAISKLVDGMTADEIVGKLLGNTCGMKGTSCADQLAKALLAAKKQSVETL